MLKLFQGEEGSVVKDPPEKAHYPRVISYIAIENGH